MELAGLEAATSWVRYGCRRRERTGCFRLCRVKESVMSDHRVNRRYRGDYRRLRRIWGTGSFARLDRLSSRAGGPPRAHPDRGRRPENGWSCDASIGDDGRHSHCEEGRRFGRSLGCCSERRSIAISARVASASNPSHLTALMLESLTMIRCRRASRASSSDATISRRAIASALPRGVRPRARRSAFRARGWPSVGAPFLPSRAIRVGHGQFDLRTSASAARAGICGRLSFKRTTDRNALASLSTASSARSTWPHTPTAAGKPTINANRIPIGGSIPADGASRRHAHRPPAASPRRRWPPWQPHTDEDHECDPVHRAGS